jgi:hypothetical protein
LVLIHPDCIYEVGAEQAFRYIDLLDKHCPLFDYVITHAFLSEQYEDWLKTSLMDENRKEAIRSLRKAIYRNSSKVIYNSRDLYGCSYAKELPDYLIDNENITIYMAGGYERNCLLISYEELFKRLVWLLKEKNISVESYSPLVFQTFEGNGLERTGSRNRW